LRDLHRVSVIESVIANLKSAFRFIRKSPSFSIAVILTLALGVGANSAVFSAIDAILLRPLPFPEGDQLMQFDQFNPKVESPQTRVAPIRLEDWNRMNSTFQSITGSYTEDGSETSGILPEKLKQAFVAPRFLQVLRVSPSLGRDFTADEEHFGGPQAILISDRFWRRRFGANPNAVGKKLRIVGMSFSIVEIMPPSFLFPDRDTALWIPVPADAPFAQNREYTWYSVIGRLKPGVTVEQARANLTTVQAQLGKIFPKPDANLAVAIQPLKVITVGGVRRSLWILFGSVSLLLLIACTNIVALLLARATQRQHEISVRFSLGAPRSAIITQLLTEAFVLAFIGAGASRVFRYLAGNLPRVEEIRLDGRIVALLTGVFCSRHAALRIISCASRNAEKYFRLAGPSQPHPGLRAQFTAVDAGERTGSLGRHAADWRRIVATQFSRARTSVSWLRVQPCSDFSHQRILRRNRRLETPHATDRSDHRAVAQPSRRGSGGSLRNAARCACKIPNEFAVYGRRAGS
jgi:putative ABC transport system permease protein